MEIIWGIVGVLLVITLGIPLVIAAVYIIAAVVAAVGEGRQDRRERDKAYDEYLRRQVREE